MTLVKDAINDRYVIEEELGQGGMGTVYKAHDKILDRVVAVKVIASQEIGTEGRAQLLAEARAVAKLNHPNIVAIYDAGEDEKLPFIVMEYIQGKSLREEPPKDFSKIYEITQRICRALLEAHANGIVHRDLKPENIIQTNDGNLKLTDFGLAVSSEMDPRIEGALEGTILYISPEQARGDELDGRADLYSLGVILYELFTGEPPFESDDPLQVISAHLNQVPVDPRMINPDIPPRVEQVILRLMAKDPESRFQSAREVFEEFFSINPANELSVPENGKHNIPENISSFIGRESEIEAIYTLFSRSRLITLTGVGGTGKSRLAYQVAREKLPDFLDGVFVIELAAVSDKQAVYKTIAETLKISERKDEDLLKIISEFLVSKEMLLVLDNCEHLIRECGHIISEILGNCPKVKMLVTSRESVGIQGEATYFVPSLAIPEQVENLSEDEIWQIESMRLFFDRAQLVQPGFSPDREETQAAIEICRRLDGIPLAIELAAARVRIIPLRELAARLSESFRLLTGGSRTALPRQQTLQATIDWSYDLLSMDEKALFHRLAVFSNGWTISAAEEICADDQLPHDQILDLLARLADKSIIAAESTIGVARYRMLETIRQYALEKLIRSKEIKVFRKNHLRFYSRYVEEASPKLRRHEQKKWFDVLEREHENIRAALEWGVNGDGDPDAIILSAKLASSFLQFWMVRGYWMEGWDWTSKIRQNPEFSGVDKSIQSRLLNAAGKIIFEMGDLGKAEEIFRQALVLARDAENLAAEAYALLGLSEIALREHYLERANQYIESSYSIFKGIGKRGGEAIALSIKGGIAFSQGNFSAARDLFNETIEINREMGNLLGVAGTLLALGNLEVMHGVISKGKEYFNESLQIFQALRDKSGEAGTLTSIALAELYTSDIESSHKHYQEALRINRELHSYPGMGTTLIALGEIARTERDFKLASEYYSEAARINENLGQYSIVMIVFHNMGYVEKSQGNYREALQYLRKALQLAVERDHHRFIVYCLIGIGAVYIDLNNKREGKLLINAAKTIFHGEYFDLDPVDAEEVSMSLQKLEADSGKGVKAETTKGEHAFSKTELIELATKI